MSNFSLLSGEVSCPIFFRKVHKEFLLKIEQPLRAFFPTSFLLFPLIAIVFIVVYLNAFLISDAKGKIVLQIDKIIL